MDRADHRMQQKSTIEVLFSYKGEPSNRAAHYI